MRIDILSKKVLNECVFQGDRQFRRSLESAGTEQAGLSEESIGFMIGPRLNAAGRLGDASPAVDLLRTEDATVAMTLAKELDTLNKERQALVSKMAEEAEQTNFDKSTAKTFLSSSLSPKKVGTLVSLASSLHA